MRNGPIRYDRDMVRSVKGSIARLSRPITSAAEPVEDPGAFQTQPHRSLTFAVVVTNTVIHATVTNIAYFSGTLETGSDAVTYHAGGTKLFLPLVMRNATP